MPTRETAPTGAPCWVDLMTSDTERSRAFYCELFGWGAEAPEEKFGGYFSFTKDGARIAGGMPTQPGVPVSDVWSVHLTTDDAVKTVDAARESGGQVVVEPMAVANLGTMAVITDPGGAAVGIWQPDTFPGFTVLGEPNTPGWFELHTRDYERSVTFYRDVFRWDTRTASDTPELRYTVQTEGGTDLAGIMDASAFLPEGVPAHWGVYFGSDDVDATLAKIVQLGGSVVQPADDTPWGRLAVATDPTGAQFKLLGPNVAS